MPLDPIEYGASRGITEKWVMEQRGYERIPEGILIPFYSLPDGLPNGYEVRLDEADEGGRKFKRPPGQRASLNIHPSQVDALRDHGQPLFIVEGTTRADALAQRGIPAVSVAGCWGFMSGKETLADFDSLTVRGRDVIIGLDGDILTNPDVNAALHRLGALMQRKGAASVEALVLPDQQGLDDWLGAGGSVLNLARHQRPLDDIVVLKPKRLSPAARARKVVGDINDTAIAEQFLQSEYANIRYLPKQDAWAAYVDGRWIQTPKNVYLRMQITEYMLEKAQAFKEDGEVRDMLLSSAKIASVASAVQAAYSVAADTEDFDADPWLFNCANGTLDLRTAMLSEHNPNDLLWGKSLTAWDSAAQCPLWEQFISEVLPNEATARTVQEILGASIVGKPLEQILPVFIGGGRNGKSVLVNTVGKVLGSDFFGDIDNKLLTAQKFDSHPENIMRLRGKRLAIASETEAGEKFATASIKRLTGDDMLTGRFMRENSTNFRPTHSLILITNNHPQVDDTGAAIWARIKKIPFNVSFVGREDIHLGDKLLAEREGILRWLVDGLRRVLGRDGRFDFSPEVAEATRGWQESENTLLGFLSSGVVVRDPKGYLSSADFTALYHPWCESADVRPLRTTALRAAMDVLGITPRRSTTERGWVGVAANDGVSAAVVTESAEAASSENPQVRGPFSSGYDGDDGDIALINTTQLALFDLTTNSQQPTDTNLAPSTSSTSVSAGQSPDDVVTNSVIAHDRQVDRYSLLGVATDSITPIVDAWAALLDPIAEPTDQEVFDDILARNRRNPAKVALLTHFTVTLEELAELTAGTSLPKSPLDLRRSLYRVREELDARHGLGVYLRRTDGTIGEYRRTKKDKSDKGKEAILICKWV